MVDSVRAVVALGNPGSKHATDRHNAGFWFADALAKRVGESFTREKRFQAELARVATGQSTVWLAKPWTYMNKAGESAAPLAKFHRIATSEILVVHDELDLPAGTARFKAGGGHGGHNGLRDITRVLGTDFKRLRIGIDHPGSSDGVLGHVLNRPSKQESAQIDDAIDLGLDATQVLFTEGWNRAAETLNSKT